MSDRRLDALAESARNRGLKLVRSRIRTPGKRGFGTVGIADATGKAVFGLDAKGPAATPEEVEDYLRNLGATDWGASLNAAARVRRKSKRAPRPSGANDAEQTPGVRPRPKPKSQPRPVIRNARPTDAPELIDLIRELDVVIDEETLWKNLSALKRSDETPLVATLGREVVGLCGINRRVAVHRAAPMGRIAILVVARQARGLGIGRMLVAAAEQRFRERGCYLVEVTSNDRLAEAHAFYRHMGYERTSIRFAKSL